MKIFFKINKFTAVILIFFLKIKNKILTKEAKLILFYFFNKNIKLITFYLIISIFNTQSQKSLFKCFQ